MTTTFVRAMRQWFVCLAFGVLLPAYSARADNTWVFAVQVSATVQASPPQISFTWIQDMYGAISYTIYRKAKGDVSWGTPIAELDGSITNFTDTNVSVGTTYEYAFVKAASLGYPGYGYIFTGINAPMIENRGKLLLMVETNATASLSTELARLQSDLVGDGWQVILHGVSSNDTPASVKSLIVADYNADPANVKAVFLFGHIPILESGNLDYDGHGARPMPADSYYGDIDGDWSSLPSYLPSDVELEVGRVDLWNMIGVGAPSPWPSETEMLRNYLNKDHNWRFKQINPQRRALMADRFGQEYGENRASTGYRNFEPFVGHGNIVMADVSDTALPTNRWISMLTAGSYLWTYACGGGFYTGISEMGLHGQYNDVWSTDIVAQDAQAVFFMLEGSHFGNWDVTDNVLRSVLITPTMGLAVCGIAGHPHWFVHHMGLGETIGYGVRLTMNNSTMYQSQSNMFTRAIYISLMGDPTLRMEPIAPPSNLNAGLNGNGVSLNWSASSDAVAGYHIYRSSSPAGPFTRLSGSLVSGTSFVDSAPLSGNATYLVRAVALQVNPSGSYYDPSQGIFATLNNTSGASITVTPSLVSGGLQLSWNSQAGTTYRVLAGPSPSPGALSDISGTLTASGNTITWVDTSRLSPRFYRIASP